MNMYQRIWKMRLDPEFPVMTKDQKVAFGSNKYSYFDINQLIEKITPMLIKHNLGIMQPLVAIGEKPAIQTTFFLTEESDTTDSGDILSFTCPLFEHQDPQDQGGEVTYFRRYALISALFMESEDMDGLTKDKAASRNATTTINDEPFLSTPVMGRKTPPKKQVTTGAIPYSKEPLSKPPIPKF